MKKVNSIFIDLRNIEQVRWWNTVASKFVKVKHYETLVETATNKPVGYILRISGLFKNYVIKENLKFLGKDVSTMVIDVEK